MIYSLCFKAELVGCYALQLSGGFDDEEHFYEFKVRCDSCNHIEKVALSFGYVNGEIFDCDNCGAEINLLMILGHGRPHFTGGMSTVPNGYTEMMRFNIDGARPLGYAFSDGWEVAYNGKMFYEINLADPVVGLWSEDYDEIDEVEAASNAQPGSPIWLEIREPQARFFMEEELLEDSSSVDDD